MVEIARASWFGQGSDTGRADRGHFRQGSRPAFRSTHCFACGRRRDHLHFPSPGRDFPDRRSGDGIEGWGASRDAAGDRGQSRPADFVDGRPPFVRFFPPRRRDQSDAPILLRAEGMNVGTRVKSRPSRLNAERLLGSPALLVRAGPSSPRLSLADCRLTPAKSRSTERCLLKRRREPRLRRGLAYLPKIAKARAC